MGDDFVCPFADLGVAMGKGFLLGLVVAVVLLIILKRFGLLRRENLALRVLVGLYWVGLPLLFGGLLGAWFFFGSMIKEVQTGLEPLREDVGELSVSLVDSVWRDVLKMHPASPDDFQALLKAEMKKRIDADIMEAVFQAPWMGAVVGKVAEGLSPVFSELVYKEIMQRLTNQAADALSMPPEQLEPLWRKGVTEALRGGLVLDVFTGSLTKGMHLARSSVMTPVAVILGLIALEIAYAAYANRRRSKAAALARA